MTLIKSISGTRGTIGGKPGNNLTPIDIVESTAAYAQWIKNQNQGDLIIVGRDGRISGELVSNIAVQTLLSMGLNVIDLGLSTTPTVEMAVKFDNAAGGIIFTASHNPKQWNALKFLNHKGEFISHADGQYIIDTIKAGNLEFVNIENLGTYHIGKDYLQKHISAILNLAYLNVEKIKSKKFKVVIDSINSTGVLAIPALLDALNCSYSFINDALTGEFAHNPEPLPKHLEELSKAVVDQNADLGIAVDPDVDRLVFVNEDGSFFGEEYTLVAVADFILSKHPGPTVSNLSSTRALSDVTRKYGESYFASAVGEVNVVKMMKAQNAVIGGEGNGGIILPDLHYGRDALVGIALMLNLLADKDCTLSALRAGYPSYEIIKNKIDLGEGVDFNEMVAKLKTAFKQEKINEIDGLKIDFEDGWVHLRKSNTEPIIRVYAEAQNKITAQRLVDGVNTVLND